MFVYKKALWYNIINSKVKNEITLQIKKERVIFMNSNTLTNKQLMILELLRNNFYLKDIHLQSERFVKL